MTIIQDNTDARKRFVSWARRFYKKRKLEPTFCGTRRNDFPHEIDSRTGTWGKEIPSNTPPRWLFRIRHNEAGEVVAESSAKSYTGTDATTSNLKIIAFHKTSTGNAKAALGVRILPVIESQANAEYRPVHEMEVGAFFVFKESIRDMKATNEPVLFDADAGELKRRLKKNLIDLPYVFAGLLGYVPRDSEITVTLGGRETTLRYGQVLDALANAIQIATTSGDKENIPVFDLASDEGFEELTSIVKEVSKQIVRANGGDGEENFIQIIDETIGKDWKRPELFGIDPTVYRQINASLRAGKKHIMLYGPPGTGKTTIARWVASNLRKEGWTMITGSADWSSQDVIGGYQPIGNGKIKFFPGPLLRDFDRPLIIDELNRCDIDKVIGPLFSVLSGQSTTLPYRIDASDPDSEQIVILAEPDTDTKPGVEYAPGRSWHLIATINTIDKAALYQMSYALSRRFGWIYVDVPSDTRKFMIDFCLSQGIIEQKPPKNAPCPLAEFWAAINENEVHAIGPAPIIDAIKAIQTMEREPDFFDKPSGDMRKALLDAVDMALLPMLDGIDVQSADRLAEVADKAFDLDDSGKARIRKRLHSAVV